MSKLRKFLLFLCLFSCAACWLIFLNQNGILQGFYRTVPISRILPDEGNAYLFPINDQRLTIRNLRIVLKEDGKSYTRNFSDTTETVREQGGGRFTVWEDGSILFSASDNSSPLENGRSYLVRFPYIIGKVAARRFYFGTAFLILILFLSFIKPILSNVKIFFRSAWHEKKVLLQCMFVSIPFLFCFGMWGMKQSFWADELFTMEHYCFSGSWTFPAAFYDYPNNHILFNLILSLYFKTVRIMSFCQAVQAPWRIRIFLFLFAGITFVFTGMSAWKINQKAALPAVILMSTSLPFFMWSTQARGYGLTMACASALGYAMISNFQESTRQHLIWCSLLSAALIYTMPVNVVLIASVMIFTGIILLTEWLPQLKERQSGETGVSLLKKNAQFKLLLSFLTGIGLAAALYVPVLSQMLPIYTSGEYSPGKKADFGSFIINEILKRNFNPVMKSFFSFRWLMILFCLCGICILCRRFSDSSRKLRYGIWLSFSAIFFTFLIFALTRYHLFNRSLLMLLPPFVLLCALLIGEFLEILPSSKWRVLAVLLIFIYCSAVFVFHVNQSRKKLPSDMAASMDNLSEPYFVSEKLNPTGMLNQIDSMNTEKLPVIWSDPSDFYNYLLCPCFQQTCYCDYWGADAQKLIQSGDPYWMIQTVTAASVSDPSSALSDTYREMCSLKVETGAFRVYRCEKKN